MSFIKLNNNFVINHYELDKKFVQYGTIVDGIFRGTEYYTGKIDTYDHIISVIPEIYRELFSISILKITTKSVPPHTDSNIKSTINFYIKPGNCVTSFYKFKESLPKKYQIENQTTGYIYNKDDLIETENFIALPNQAYLLDVTMPHSVYSLNNKFDNRIVVCIQSRECNFTQVAEMLKSTGNL
jgi:hypothetical protein